jgi:hypothetical protein
MFTETFTLSSEARRKVERRRRRRRNEVGEVPCRASLESISLLRNYPKPE